MYIENMIQGGDANVSAAMRQLCEEVFSVMVILDHVGGVIDMS
ncbi:hypothetical protein [Gudongella sp. SC589]